MVCAKCGKEDIAPGDAFCRHCGSAVATSASASERAGGVAIKTPVAATNSEAGKGLQILGGVIFVVVALLGPAVAVFMGLSDFRASVFPWVAGSLMLAGLGMAFIGTKMRHAH